jgi:hypothetical protein
MQPPLPNGLPHGLAGLVADSRSEIDEKLAVTILGTSRPKSVSQKIKPRLREMASPVIVPTVHNTRFILMKLQSTFPKTPVQLLQQFFSLSSCPAMGHSIICVSRSWILRSIPLHPQIKHIMKEQVRQQRTDHASLRRSRIASYHLSIFRLKRRLEPPLNIKNQPFTVGVCSDRAQ